MNATKMLPAPAVTNGKSSQPIKEVPKVLTPQAPPPKTELKAVSKLDDRLHELSVLWDLQKKHSKLQEAKKELTGFEIAQNKENSTLELCDDEQNEFKTSNPVIIAAVVDFVLKLINTKSAELEQKLVS